MTLYFWLFNRTRHPLIFRLWLRYSRVLALCKHLRRGNWKLALIWARFVVGI